MDGADRYVGQVDYRRNFAGRCRRDGGGGVEEGDGEDLRLGDIGCWKAWFRNLYF